MEINQAVQQAVAHVHAKAAARATGSWSYRDNQLTLEFFMACPEMKPEVATGFPQATAYVPVTDTGLGIVLAARTRQTTEYRALDLPPDSGSGYWIRAFEADRSVAVPQFDATGQLIRILSVAVTGLETPEAYYEQIVLEAFALYLNRPGRA
jgi:hypothetical protein